MKKIKLIIIIICLAILPPLFSQNLSSIWVKHYGGVGSDYFFKHNSIEIDSINNCFVSGYFNNEFIDTVLVNGFYTAKFSLDGTLEKVKCLGDSSYFLSFDVDKNNNLLYVNSVEKPNGEQIITLVKLNQNFQLEWNLEFKSFWSSIGFISTKVNEIQIDENNNIYLAFSENDLSTILPNNDTIFNYIFIVKVNSDGQFIRAYPIPNYYGLNYFNIENNYNSFSLAIDNRIVVYDSIPQPLAIQDFGTFDIYNYFYDNNYFYLTVRGVDTLFGNTTIDSITNNNLFLLKLNQSLEIVWTKKLKGFRECPFPNNPQYYMCNSSFTNIVTTTHNDDIFISGLFKYKFSINNNYYYTNDSSKYSFFITKFDKLGNYHWTEVFESNETSIQEGKTTIEVKVLSDNTLLCGLMFETQVQIGDSLYTSKGDKDILFMRLQETGTGLKPVANNKRFDFEVFPNPATDILNVEIQNIDKTLQNHLKVYNFLGNVVLETNDNNNSFSLNIRHLNAGLYFISIENELGKLVKKVLIL